MAQRINRTRNFRFGTLGFLRVLALSVRGVTPASGFGTIDGARQHAEHECITRSVLPCPLDIESNGECSEQDSLDQFADRTGTFGEIGASDRPGGGELQWAPPGLVHQLGWEAVYAPEVWAPGSLVDRGAPGSVTRRQVRASQKWCWRPALTAVRPARWCMQPWEDRI
jgi:hypothetical protein